MFNKYFANVVQNQVFPKISPVSTVTNPAQNNTTQFMPKFVTETDIDKMKDHLEIHSLQAMMKHQ